MEAKWNVRQGASIIYRTFQKTRTQWTRIQTFFTEFLKILNTSLIQIKEKFYSFLWMKFHLASYEIKF